MKNKNELFFNNTFFTEKVTEEKIEDPIKYNDIIYDDVTWIQTVFCTNVRSSLSNFSILKNKKLS